MGVRVGEGVAVAVGIEVKVGDEGTVGVTNEMDSRGMLQATKEEVSNKTAMSSFFMDWTIHARQGGVKVG
jgi:hypothetical protein